MKRYIALIAGIILIGSFIHYFPTEEGSQNLPLLSVIMSEEVETKYIDYQEKDIYPEVYSMITKKIGYTPLSNTTMKFSVAEPIIIRNVYRYPYYYEYNAGRIAQTVIVKKHGVEIARGTGNTLFVFDKEYKYEVYWKINSVKHTGETGFHIIKQIYKYIPQVSLVRVTTTAIVFQTDIPFYLEDNTVSIVTGIKNSQTKIIQDTNYTFAIVGLTPNTRYKIGYGDGYIWEEIIVTTLEKPPPNTIVAESVTPASITFRSSIENYLQNYTVEIYDKNSFTKLDKPITQDTTYTFTISELTPNTEYRIVYGDKEMFVTTLEETETLDLIPLGTEKTSNSFVQVYKVIGKDVNHNIQLKYENNVWNYDPQFDGENYYVVFDELVTGDYDYTIIVSNMAGEKRYSNSFYIKNIEEDLGISLDVDPAKIGEDSFYLRFKVTGEGYYDTYFEYMNEQTFKVEEADINHGIRYDDVTIENLTEGDYSYKLILSTEKGNIEHEGSFTIKKEVQSTYVPPYTPPSENKNFLPYLAVIIIILVIGYILIKPKTIKTKKRRK